MSAGLGLGIGLGLGLGLGLAEMAATMSALSPSRSCTLGSASAAMRRCTTAWREAVGLTP